MPEKKSPDYRKNPFAMPEPYYLPGYTGHCPKYNDMIGQTFGRATHSAIKEEPSACGRLRPLPEKGQWLGCYAPNLEPEDIAILEERQSRQGRALLKKDIAPGYRGHIPRASQVIGLTFNQSCIKGVAEFEKRMRKLEKMVQSKTMPDSY